MIAETECDSAARLEREALDTGRIPSSLRVVPLLQETPKITGKTGETGSVGSHLLWRWSAPAPVMGLAHAALAQCRRPPAVAVARADGSLSILELSSASGNETTTEPQQTLTPTEITPAIDETLIDSKGSCVVALAAGRLGPHSSVDLVIADAEGTVAVVLAGEQIFVRTDVGAPISCLEIHAPEGRQPQIIVGDTFGAITAINLHGSITWKSRLVDIAPTPTPCSDQPTHPSPLIRDLHSVTLRDGAGTPSHYVLACDGRPFLHYIANSVCALSVEIPSQIQSITSGSFTYDKHVRDKDKRISSQIALGGLDGVVYIVDGVNVIPHFNLDLPLMRIERFRPSWLENDNAPDMLLCAGHFAHVAVLHGGALVHRVETPDWVWCMSVYGDEIALGLMDQSVRSVKLVKRQ